MKTYNTRSARIMSFCCILALMASFYGSAACTYRYADYRQDAPAGPCDAANNDPEMANFIECSYEASLAPFFCRPTTAFTDCTEYIDPVTGTPAVCSAYVNTMAGWCVDGTCNYFSVVLAQSDWFQDRPMVTTVDCTGG
jgi:hypothetical protein